MGCVQSSPRDRDAGVQSQAVSGAVGPDAFVKHAPADSLKTPLRSKAGQAGGASTLAGGDSAASLSEESAKHRLSPQCRSGVRNSSSAMPNTGGGIRRVGGDRRADGVDACDVADSASTSQTEGRSSLDKRKGRSALSRAQRADSSVLVRVPGELTRAPRVNLTTHLTPEGRAASQGVPAESSCACYGASRVVAFFPDSPDAPSLDNILQKDPAEVRAPEPCSESGDTASFSGDVLIWLPRTAQVPFGEHYELGRFLGKGHFATTHVCRDKESGETLACKAVAKAKLTCAPSRWPHRAVGPPLPRR